MIPLGSKPVLANNARIGSLDRAQNELLAAIFGEIVIACGEGVNIGYCRFANRTHRRIIRVGGARLPTKRSSEIRQATNSFGS
jgi:hypothetical protein